MDKIRWYTGALLYALMVYIKQITCCIGVLIIVLSWACACATGSFVQYLWFVLLGAVITFLSSFIKNQNGR